MIYEGMKAKNQLLMATLEARKNLSPPLDLSASQWADLKAYLSPESSAEPGKYRTDRAPFQKGILDAVSDKDVRGIVMMKSAQIGYTVILGIIIAYYIDHEPCPILLVQPTGTMAKAFSKDRLAPMIRDTPALRGKIKNSRERDSGNTTLHKQFPGGQLTIAAAGSSSDLASRPIRVVLLDEVDRYEQSVKNEGDPSSLAIKRTNNYWNAKWIMGSTPTRANESRVYDEFKKSDQRYFKLTCPHCGEMQALKFDGMKWEEGKPETAFYACEHNGCVINDGDKLRMLQTGVWQASKPSAGIAGFHISELYSPWRSWAQIASDYESKKTTPETMQTFWNTVLGLPFEEVTEGVDAEKFIELIDQYERRSVPNDVGVLTGFVDIQKDRVEYSVWGWGRHQEPYLIDHQIKIGSITRAEFREEVAEELRSAEFFRMDGRPLKIKLCGVDAGYETKSAYDIVRLGGAAFVATKGVGGFGRDVVTRPSYKDLTISGKVLKRGIKLYPMGVDNAKVWAQGRFGLAANEVGRVHFPDGMSDDYFEQLCVERLQSIVVRGYKQRRWIKESGARNEAFDCFVGAFAMSLVLGIDKWSESRWQSLTYVATDKPVQVGTEKPVEKKKSFWDKA